MNDCHAELEIFTLMIESINFMMLNGDIIGSSTAIAFLRSVRLFYASVLSNKMRIRINDRRSILKVLIYRFHDLSVLYFKENYCEWKTCVVAKKLVSESEKKNLQNYHH